MASPSLNLNLPEGFKLDEPEKWSERVLRPQADAFHKLPEGFELDEPEVRDQSIHPNVIDAQRSVLENLPEGFVLDEAKPTGTNIKASEGPYEPPISILNEPHKPLRSAEATGLFLKSDEKGNISPGAIPQALMDIWEDMKAAVHSGGKDQNAVTRLAGALAGGGVARAAVAPKGELGAFGGRLIEGGKKTVERTIDDISDNLVGALKNVHPDKTPDLSKAKAALEELKTHAVELEKQEAGLLPDMSKMTQRDLDRMGMTLEQYKTEFLKSLNTEIDQSQREMFKVLSGGRDPNKPITVENIVGWLKDAGVEGVSVATKGKWDTTYITWRSPTGQKQQVRLPSDGHASPQGSAGIVDTAKMSSWEQVIFSLSNKFGLH